MYRKTCTRCGKDSYSAESGNGEWRCPCCGKDLANEPVEPAADDKKNNTIGAKHPAMKGVQSDES